MKPKTPMPISPFRARALLPAILGALLLCASGWAQALRLIPFQARMDDQNGDPVVTGTKNFTFRLYRTPVGGTAAWTERHEGVQVLDGIVSLMLGGVVPFSNIDGDDPVDLNEYRAGFQAQYYLGVTVGDATGEDPEMLPRTLVSQALFAADARRASFADQVLSAAPQAAIKQGGSSGSFTLPGEDMALDASFSSDPLDPDKSQLKYAFDDSGDGVFTTFTSTSVTGTFPAPSKATRFSAKVQSGVSGLISTDSTLFKPYTIETVTVDEGAAVGSIGASTDVGQYCSLAIIGGNPMIAYHDATNDVFRIAIATEPTGLGAWTVVVPSNIATISGGNVIGEHISLATIGGDAAVAYFDLNAKKPYYAYPTALGDYAGVWTAIQIGTSGDSRGQFAGLVAAGTTPGVVYLNNTTAALDYAISGAAQPTMSSDWTASAVDATASVGKDASVAIVNNTLGAAYYDADTGDLKYARTDSLSGTTWTPMLVDNGGGVGGTPAVGLYTSVTAYENKPAIAYYDSTNQELKYIRADVASPANNGAWVNRDIIVGGGVNGIFASLAVVGGRPVIAYHDVSGGNLSIALVTPDNAGAIDDLNAANWMTFGIDSQGTVGEFASLIELNGRPAIAYYDRTNGALKFASFARR